MKIIKRLKAKETVALDFDVYGIDFIEDEVYGMFEDGYVETENGSSVYLSDEEIKKYFEII